MSNQQRTSQRRRNSPNPGGAQIPTIDWDAVIISPTILRIRLRDLKTGLRYDRVGWAQTGIPQFEIQQTLQPSIGVTPITQGWDVEFAGPLTAPCSVWRTTNNPDLRGPSGIFLAGKNYDITPGPPPPTNVEMATATISGNEVIVTYINPSPWTASSISLVNAKLRGAEPPITEIFTGSGATFGFAATPLSGDLFEFAPSGAELHTPSEGIGVNGTLFLP